MTRMDATPLYKTALDHYTAGRVAEAEAALRSAVAGNPRDADAVHLLAVVSLGRGNAVGATVLARRAVALRPTFAVAWNTLGECHRSLGQPDAAAACYRKAIDQDPAMAAAHSNLAMLLVDAGQGAAAVAAARQAVAAAPSLVSAHSVLGTALRQSGDLDGAIAAHRRAVELGPNDGPALNNLGTALEAADQLPEAMAAYRRAAEARPDLAVTANNYLNVARQLNRWDDALAWTDRVLRGQPDFAPARWNRGLLRLTHGDYANGLPEYELRFVATDQRHPPALTRPAWTGREDMAGRTLLVYAEQGQGDGFQAARYLPIVARRVGRVVVLCHAGQVRLFAGVQGVSAVVGPHDPLPPYDRFAAVMSLPYLCGTTSLEAIPKDVPYLSAPPECVEQWRARLSAVPGDGPKVGLVWAGATKPDPLRTIPAAELAPLLAVPGVRWFSLQVGPAAGSLATVPGGDRVTDLSPALTDFAETAAAMAQLDLVVTIDTSTAHLAGAAGRPTWTLLPFSPDWRWLLDRADSPWYPTMRLFRQTERKQWGPVVERVADELRAVVAGRPALA